MQLQAAVWFETKVKYDKMMDNGLLRPTTETYVVDALSFAEAESRIIQEITPFISGDFKITNIVEAPYREVCFSSDTHDDRWYKAKLQFITIDEATEKEKRQNIYYLLQAATLAKAVAYINEMMSKTMFDYVITSVAETAIIDVYEHKIVVKTKQKTPDND